MRKIIITFCILLAALSLKAQTVKGIRIDGGNTPILVYVGGNQMCLPTTSCFVANLKPGYYSVEVYETRFGRPGERVWKGEKLYSQRVYYKGGVQDVFVDDRGSNVRPERPRPGQEQGNHHPNNDIYVRVMDDQLFEEFLKSVKKEAFSDSRVKIIDTALTNTDFTVRQCMQLVKVFAFNNDKVEIMKKMYPQIVDKEAFFTVISTLTFSSDRDKMNEFVRQYNKR